MIKSSLLLPMTVAAFSIASCSDEPEPTAADNAYEDYQASLRAAIANDTGESADERRKRLREKAKTDPNGADAEAIDSMGQNEVIATAINSAGYLCARVVSAYPVGGNINVECIEYRSGKGRAKYRIDPNASTVEPR